jgi:hypothetical protein
MLRVKTGVLAAATRLNAKKFLYSTYQTKRRNAEVVREEMAKARDPRVRESL